MAKFEILSCRRSRVCELWSHFNPTVEERWKRPLPLQRLWLVVTKIPSVNVSRQHYLGNFVSKILYVRHHYHHRVFGGGKYGWIMSPQVSTTRWTGRTGHLSNPNAGWYFSYFIQQNFSIFFFCWASKWEIIQKIKIIKKSLQSSSRREGTSCANCKTTATTLWRRFWSSTFSLLIMISHNDQSNSQYFTFFSLQKPEWRASLQCLRPLLQTS